MKPKGKYIEQRIEALEEIVGGLFRMVGNSLDRESKRTNFELGELRKQMKRSRLKRRKPVKPSKKK